MPAKTVSLEALPDIPNDVRGKLQELWITSVDELWALHTNPGASPHLRALLGLEEADSSNLIESMPVHLAPNRLQALTAAPSTRGLGCLVPEEVVQRLMLRPTTPIKSSMASGLGASLPSEVSLLEIMGPVKDQGGRGTCVAFAWCGLREYWSRAEPRYSEQFLYWACKQLDGIPGEEGSYIRTGAGVLRELGVCTAPLWPYNPRPIPGSVDQGPAPQEAVVQASQHALPHQRVVQDVLIEDFKAVLAGHPGGPPCPVVFGVLVFPSWMLSSEVARTGKIHMPLPGEFPIGGHAMCAVGYRDDPSAPGGGFLIVRNSWGEGWAADSPFRQGHAMLPYAYVERFCSEAFAAYPLAFTESSRAEAISGSSDALVASAGSEPSGFVRVLEKSARDHMGERLAAGTKVLANHLAPEEFLADTPGNKQRFVDGGHAWSDPVRTRYWLPSLNKADSETRAERSRLADRVETFLANTSENLTAAPGKLMPRLGRNGLLTFLVDPPRIRQTRLVADLGLEHARALAEAAAPEALKGLTWSDEWLSMLQAIVPVQVWEVSSRRSSAIVVAASLVDVQLAAPGQLEFLPGGNEEWERLLAVWTRFAGKAGLAGKPVFFTLYGSAGWTEGFGPLAQPGRVRVLSELDETGALVGLRPSGSVSAEVRIFLDNLRPDTAPQRAERIAKAARHHAVTSASGHFTVKRAVDLLGLPVRLVRSAFAALPSDEVSVFKTPSGELALTPERRKDAIQLKPSGVERSPFVRHAVLIIGSAIAVGGWFASRVLTENIDRAALAVPVMIFIAYLVDRIRSWLRRWAQLKD